MLDIATHKIGDRWFLEFEESLTPADMIADIKTDQAGEALNVLEPGPVVVVKEGQVVLLFKSGAWSVRTPVKAEPKSRLEKDIESAELGLAMLGMGSH